MAQPMQVLQHEQLPPEAFQHAATYQLGTPIQLYKVGYSKSTIWSGIAGIVMAILFIFIAFSATTSSGDNSAVIVVMGGVALLFLAMAIYCLFYPLIYRSWCVYVCSDGFVSTRWNKIEGFRWDQIVAVWQSVTRRYTNGVYTGTTHIYTVQRQDGVKVIFKDQFKDVESLGNTIIDKSSRLLVPQVIAAYNAGGVVTFGSLSVSSQGLSNGKSIVPWNEISEVGLNRGMVIIKKEGKMFNWASPMVAKVPNIFVMLALINYARTGQL